MTPLPYCFFLTQVVCLADDEALLKALYSCDHQCKDTWKLFKEPQAALAALNSSDKPKILFDRILQDHGTFLDCNSIGYLYEEIYNPERFQTISCVLVDEKVQGINGLEICRQITDPNIQKIFLTSSLEAETVIAAFNQGWIDYYLPKTSPDFSSHLHQLINRAQHRYFEALTANHMISLLKQAVSDSHDSSPLNEPCFRDYLKFLLESPSIHEYYPLDLMGSFLLINTHGQASALLAFTDSSLARHMLDGAELIQAEPHLWKKIGGNSLPSAFCIPSLYHPIFQDLKPFLVPVYPQEFGQQHYNLALISQIGNCNPFSERLGSSSLTRKESK